MAEREGRSVRPTELLSKHFDTGGAMGLCYGSDSFIEMQYRLFSWHADAISPKSQSGKGLEDLVERRMAYRKMDLLLWAQENPRPDIERRIDEYKQNMARQNEIKYGQKYGGSIENSVMHRPTVLLRPMEPSEELMALKEEYTRIKQDEELISLTNAIADAVNGKKNAYYELKRAHELKKSNQGRTLWTALDAYAKNLSKHRYGLDDLIRQQLLVADRTAEAAEAAEAAQRKTDARTDGLFDTLYNPPVQA